MAKITINNITLDPEAQSGQIKTMGLESTDATSSNYIIIQTDGPLTKENKEQLKSKKINVLEYVPKDAYICQYKPSNLSEVRNLPFVTWADVYFKGFKIPQNLTKRSNGNGSNNLLELRSPETSMTQDPREVSVVFHKGVKPNNKLLENIAKAIRMDIESVTKQTSAGAQDKVRIMVRPQDLENLAEIDEVRHLELVSKPKLCGEVALGILKADEVHKNGTKLQGEGEIVTVCDTGFDLGKTSNPHPAFKNRVLKLYALGRMKSDDPNGHGTHVAGSVLGDGKYNGGTPVRGTAPKANLIVQSVLDNFGGLGGLPDDLKELYEVAYADGSRIHTNSWGAAVNGLYTDNSKETDEFIWNNRDFTICFAAGNEGTDQNSNGRVDQQSVGSPGTAKNCITVGASESNRPDKSKPYGIWSQDFPSEPLSSDMWADNPEGMAAFSSRGPTKDSRIKPDVVAPGTSILSAHSQAASVGDFWGSSSDSKYCFMGGTSMATPLVAGCAAVVRQFLQNDGTSNPTASLVKAMLINGATDIQGQYVPSEAPNVPNFDEGFGRVNLKETVGPWDNGTELEYWNEDKELDTGDEITYSIPVRDGSQMVKVTLVWTDVPGENLQNDLDLIVEIDGEKRNGNMPAGSQEFDRINNVEQVIWTNPTPGKAKVTVRAYNIPVHKQSFSLVARVV